ncbi:MAG: hypothetical protein IPK04_00250 [Bdellovibrionales bacterium]|nr:hypothetical protein [Bdellovibrionales bacterium]
MLSYFDGGGLLEYISKLKLGQRAFVAIVMGGGLLMLFQNCGKAGFDSVAASDSDSNPNGLTAIENGVPFAFKMTFDTIAYNSSFGTSLAARASQFTFRAGAYSTGGVRVTREFFDYGKAKLKPTYPNETVTAGQLKDLLAGSAANKNSQLQFAIRQQSNLKDTDGIYRTGAAALVGIDFYNTLGPLTDERWADPMIGNFMKTTSEPDFVKYFVMGPRGYRGMEISHSWNASEGLAQSVRNEFRTNAIMTLTVEDSTMGAGIAKGPSEEITKAYGTGYLLGFGVELPPYLESCVPVMDANPASPTFGQYLSGCGTPYVNPAPNSLNPDNILSSIQEVDLATGVPSSAVWVCDKKLRLMIVRPADQPTMCPKGEDLVTGARNLSGYFADLEQIRRVLPAEQWDINLTRRCVVPKDGDNYSQEKLNNKLVQVQYDSTKTCFQALEGITYPTISPAEICAQYISVCTRQE